MDNIEFIGGESTEEEMNKISSEIIDKLERFNLADKVHIIGSLYRSLIDSIKEMGGVIEERDESSPSS